MSIKYFFYKFISDIKEINKYPPVVISSGVSLDYNKYWDKKRKDNGAILSSWQKERADIISKMIKNGSSVMDIGCGDGAILKYLQDKIKISGIGVDLSDNILTKAERIGIKTIKMDISNIEELDSLPMVDYILGLEIIEHLPNSEEVVLKLKNKAKRGLIFSFPNTGYYTHRLRLLIGKTPLQWVSHPGEHLRFWTVRDVKWWVNYMGLKLDSLIVYQGLPFLNKIFPKLFGQGIIIKINCRDFYDKEMHSITERYSGDSDMQSLLRKVFFYLRGGKFINLVVSAKKIFFKIIKKYFLYIYFKIFKSRDFFEFNGKRLFYFFHLYNNTFLNERAIEIPIAKKEIKNNIKGDILEVGNVLSYYFPVKHDVVDKFDKTDSVIKKDIVDFKTDKKYDLILSVSTIEHVGFDEEPKDNHKVIKAIEHMRGLLKDGGRILVTVPLGYNSNLDKIIKERGVGFDQEYFFKKVSKNNKWIETGDDILTYIKYNSPYLRANGLFVGVIIKNNSV